MCSESFVCNLLCETKFAYRSGSIKHMPLKTNLNTIAWLNLHMRGHISLIIYLFDVVIRNCAFLGNFIAYSCRISNTLCSLNQLSLYFTFSYTTALGLVI